MQRLSALLFGLSMATLAAPDTIAQNPDGSPPVISGSVVLPGGQPAAGATVWLLKGNYDKPDRPLGRVTADDRGRFAFADLDLKTVFDQQGRFPHLLARDGQGRLGWSPTLYPNNWAEMTHKIQLLEVGEVRGRLVDSAAAPIPKARIAPSILDIPEPDRRHSGQGVLFPEFAREYDAETAADGTFVLHRLPTRAVIWATVTAPGFGSPRVQWKTADPVTIRLEKAGGIRGTVTGAKEPRTAAGIKLELHGQRRGKDSPCQISYSANAVTGEDGTFRFDDVPPGKYTLWPRLPPTMPFYADPPPAFEVKPGEAAAVALALHPAVAVRGRVIDKAGGAGVKDVLLMVNQVKPQQARDWTTTDAQGGYTAYIKPASVSLFVQRTPNSHLAPGNQQPPQVDGTRDVTYPDIALERAARLDGVVVDAAGKPVPGAQVSCLVPDFQMAFLGREPTPVTDSQGRFTVTRLDPNDSAPFRARTARAVTAAPVIVVPADQSGPVRLVLSEDKAFRLRGTVVDVAGKPIPDAVVRVEWSFHYASKKYPGWGSGVSLLTHWTDADGRFETDALWPGEEYRVRVTAPGYGDAESVRFTGRPGVAHDLGRLTLIRTGGVVQGKVVDSAGQPLAGVRVFNAGDAPQSGSTQTGADGTFRLSDLFVGPVYVFAQKDGYRFTGVRVPTGGPAVTIKLLKTGEAIPQPERPPRERPFAEDRRLARQLLEKLWALPPELRQSGLRGILESMTRLDPARALRWADQVGGPYPTIVRTTAALDLAATDVDETLTLLSQVDGDSAYRTLRDLTKRYARSGPAKALRFAEETTVRAKALRFAEEAIVRARALEQPARTASLATMGGLVQQLGKEEVGRKLIDEAADMAAKLGADGRQQWVRGTAATALAPYDLPRALKLLEPIREPGPREQYLGSLAVALAPHDLPRALEIVAKFAKSSTQPDLVRLTIAYRLAASQPDKAIQVVEGMDSFDATKMKAEGFAWLAVAVAPKDKPLAWSLMDRSLDIYLRHTEELRSWSNEGGASALAARVAGQAREVGYPDMESVIYRVLAMRPPAQYDSPARTAETDVATALILALADPVTARQLLEGVEPRRHLIGTGSGSVGRKHWLLAWTLADPARAVKLFDEELASLKGEPQGSLEPSGLADVVEILTTPPPARPYRLLRFYGGFSFPGEE